MFCKTNSPFKPFIPKPLRAGLFGPFPNGMWFGSGLPSWLSDSLFVVLDFTVSLKFQKIDGSVLGTIFGGQCLLCLLVFATHRSQFCHEFLDHNRFYGRLA